LDESDRQQVDRHLAGCPTCRAELEDLTGLKSALNTLYDAQPGTSPHTSRTVRQSVTREALARHPKSGGQRSRLDILDGWFRSLFVSRWVPTLAAMLLMAQIGLIMWLSIPTPYQEPITTRSLGMQTARIVVVFQNAATEEQIRGLLQSIHGHIADGPTADGHYTLEIPAADSSTLQHKLGLLRARQDLVRSAAPASP
jgi:predicted anti-sigma-YlaC factor YlaD